MDKRIVITGLGVVSPNGVGLDNFTNAVKNGTSGIEYQKTLIALVYFMAVWLEWMHGKMRVFR